MRIEGHKRLESSFLSVEKDAATITKELFTNDRLKKLLYYDSKDCLDRKSIDDIPESEWPLESPPDKGQNGRTYICYYPYSSTGDARVNIPKDHEGDPIGARKFLINNGWRPIPPTASLFGRNIKVVPKLKIETEVNNYIVINFDGFSGNGTNPYYRDNLIEFAVVCHVDSWYLGDFKLRPFRIAAELDSALNNKKMSGIGRLQFIGADQIILNDEFAGISLLYAAIHGDDDKVPNPTNPEEIRHFAYIFGEDDLEEDSE